MLNWSNKEHNPFVNATIKKSIIAGFRRVENLVRMENPTSFPMKPKILKKKQLIPLNSFPITKRQMSVFCDVLMKKNFVPWQLFNGMLPSYPTSPMLRNNDPVRLFIFILSEYITQATVNQQKNIANALVLNRALVNIRLNRSTSSHFLSVVDMFLLKYFGSKDNPLDLAILFNVLMASSCFLTLFWDRSHRGLSGIHKSKIGVIRCNPANPWYKIR